SSAGVVAQQVVDLAEHHLCLGTARRIAELLVALERLRDERSTLGGHGTVARDVAEQAKHAGLARLVARAPESVERLLRLGAGFVELADVAQRLGSPEGALG